METDDTKILNLFIGDVNRNMGSIGREINSLSTTNTNMCVAMKELRDSINMNRVRADIYKGIKEDVMKLRPKKLALQILDKMNRHLFVDYDF